MRKLMWFGIGFGAACALGAYLLPGDMMLVFGICLLLIAVGGLLMFREVSRKRAGAIVLLGLSVGMIWYQVFCGLTLSACKTVDGSVRTVSAEASDYSYETDYGTAVDAVVKLGGKQYKAKMYLNDWVEVCPGDEINGDFLLRFTGPDGEKENTYYSGNGVFLLCYDRGEEKIEAVNDRSLTHWPSRLRRQIQELTEAAFPEDTAAFAKALLLGDTSDLTYEEETALTVSGIVHVVSVSGLHVSILFTLLFRLLGRRRIVTPVAGFGLLLFVAALTGFSPSIVRACLMNGLILLALMLNRGYDGPTGLAFAVVVMLGVNPLSVTSVGLQLSVASVMGIMAFSDGIGEWIRGLPIWGTVKRRTLKARVQNWLAGSVSVSIGATIMTAPLTAIHFGTVSLVGLLTNLLTIWALNIVFSGAIFAVILAAVWLPGAKLLAWCLSWGVRFSLWVAKLLSGFPLAAVYTESIYIVWWLVFCYIMLAVFLLMRKKRVMQLCLCAGITFAVALGLSYVEPRLDNYRITVIDVGQGQCVLLQSEGKTYMVDCGGDHDEDTADKAVAVLYSQGVFRLDGLILTHFDQDHVGAAQYFLSRVPVEQLYLPIGDGSEQWEAGIVDSTDADVIYVDESMLLQWDGARMHIFASSSRQTANESSLCILFQKENYDILITGDRNEAGEMDLLLREEIPQLDALVVGHHGSNSSTADFFLERTQPAVALISVGADNSYGHPSEKVLERLREYGCVIRRTDLEGTIIIRG